MQQGSNVLHFYYDSQARPAMVDWNGVIYTYVHNLQGDIIAILDNTGTAVVTYSYDPWGALMAIGGSKAITLGKLNPFRYRGYIYDEESGLYYLRSRYYKPEWCRFINADTVLGKVGAVGSHNLFAYCGNNPVMMADPNGRFAKTLAGVGSAIGGLPGAIVGGIIGCALMFAMNPPKISLPKISITSSTAIGVSSISVETSSISNPKVLAREITAADVANLELESNYMTGEAFYIAYALKDTDNSPIIFINYPITMQQAKKVLGVSGLLDEIVTTASVGYAEGVFGVYTPSQASAALLSKEVGGGVKPWEHFSTAEMPGTYFWHYDGPGHRYHIWYGLPIT